jgi:hypothetical protein
MDIFFTYLGEEVEKPWCLFGVLTATVQLLLLELGAAPPEQAAARVAEARWPVMDERN